VRDFDQDSQTLRHPFRVSFPPRQLFSWSLALQVHWCFSVTFNIFPPTDLSHGSPSCPFFSLFQVFFPFSLCPYVRRADSGEFAWRRAIFLAGDFSSQSDPLFDSHAHCQDCTIAVAEKLTLLLWPTLFSVSRDIISCCSLQKSTFPSHFPPSLIQSCLRRVVRCCSTAPASILAIPSVLFCRS